jgi:hypothetical protein
MSDDLSRDLTSRMPIVPQHLLALVCGCIIAAVVMAMELCNECGAVVGVIQINESL